MLLDFRNGALADELRDIDEAKGSDTVRGLETAAHGAITPVSLLAAITATIATESSRRP